MVGIYANSALRDLPGQPEWVLGSIQYSLVIRYAIERLLGPFNAQPTQKAPCLPCTVDLQALKRRGSGKMIRH